MKNNKVERPKIGVGCIIIREKKVLLGYRKGTHGSGTFAYTGGHLEFGETLEECAKRKAYEEAGLSVSELQLVCVSNIIEYGKHYVDVEFIARIIKGEPRNLKSTIDEWKWYDVDNLPKPLFKPVELALNSLKNGTLYNP